MPVKALIIESRHYMAGFGQSLPLEPYRNYDPVRDRVLALGYGLGLASFVEVGIFLVRVGWL
jgi:hypothetical protein